MATLPPSVGALRALPVQSEPRVRCPWSLRPLAAPFLVSVCVAYALFFGGCREHAVFPPIHFIPDKTSVAAVLVWSGIRDCANVAKSFAYPRQTPFPVKLVG